MGVSFGRPVETIPRQNDNVTGTYITPVNEPASDTNKEGTLLFHFN